MLDYVVKDETLDLELRGTYITVYYRGAKLLTVQEKDFKIESLDKKYCNALGVAIPNLCIIEEYILHAKQIVDFYISGAKTSNHLGEKEIQQLIVRENNYSPTSLDTDYFIIDIEFQNDEGRFDVVALRWDSTSSARKLSKDYIPSITVFEVKQGINAISRKSGLVDHIEDFEAFKDNTDLEEFRNDMIAVFEQKRVLGLIRGTEKYGVIKKVSDDIDFVFLLTNYKPASQQLTNTLKDIASCKFISSNMMGYGLYAANVMDKGDFENAFLK